MKKIIYNKYSNERDDKFKVRTTILENELGKKFVQKVPLTDIAKEHINNMENHYYDLVKQYKDLSINKVNKQNNTLLFEYLEGKTLDIILNELLEKHNYKEFYELIGQYIDIISHPKDIVDFELTEEFRQVFGNVKFSNNLKACTISNIDSIFTNIIVSDKWYIIDYEWTFDFPIPFNFIIYRAIYYYIIANTKREELNHRSLYRMYGITDKEIINYQIMESNLQYYILGKELLSPSFYIKLNRQNYDIDTLKQTIFNLKKHQEIQIFYDFGKGYSEEYSDKIYVELNNNIVYFQVPIKDNTVQIRIDPSNTECIIKINYLMGYTDNYYNLKYEVNGNKVNNNIIIYNTNDPQIISTDLESNTKLIKGEFIIYSISEEILLQLSNFIYRNNKLQREIQQENKINQELQDKIQQENKINQELQDKIQQENKINQELQDKIQQENKINQELQDKIQQENKINQELQDKIYLYENKLENALKNLNKEINEKNKTNQQIEEQKIIILELQKSLTNEKIMLQEQLQILEEKNLQLQNQIEIMEQTKAWKLYRKYKNFTEIRNK